MDSNVIRAGISYLLFLFLAAFGVVNISSAEVNGLTVKNNAERTVALQQDEQKLKEDWIKEEKEYVRKIELLESELDTLAWQTDKKKKYLAEMKAAFNMQEENKRKIKELKVDLEPLLDKTCEKLRSQVMDDHPYKRNERLARLNNLEKMLNNYETGLLNKTSTVLDAVMKETEYGYSADASETEIEIDGRILRVRLLSIGRLALFAVDMDGRKAWKWNRRKGRFVNIDQYAGYISDAADMASHLRLVDLVELPLGVVEEVESDD